MNDNKLKDNEIIKAFKRITEYQGFTLSASKTLKSTLDLINRLQAQNEDLAETVHNLTLEKDALFDKLEELKAEVEKLNALIKTKNELIKGLDQSISYAYDRAIEEFAERLKEKSFQSFGNYGITRDVVEVCDIDNLVKEMVGDDND